jgi:hypothetical protein
MRRGSCSSALVSSQLAALFTYTHRVGTGGQFELVYCPTLPAPNPVDYTHLAAVPPQSARASWVSNMAWGNPVLCRQRTSLDALLRIEAGGHVRTYCISLVCVESIVLPFHMVVCRAALVCFRDRNQR